MSGMSGESWVLKEAEAIELLALLITSARTQMDEPAQYGPMRLLAASERLSSLILERSSGQSREFLRGNLERIPEMRMTMADIESYTADMDALCRAVAECLLRHSALREPDR